MSNAIVKEFTLSCVMIFDRHLLRLGSGVKNLAAEYTSGRDFSKLGRIKYSLDRRNLLLREVQTLAESLGVFGTRTDEASETFYTCEAAEYFFFSRIKSRIEQFHVLVSKALRVKGQLSADQLPSSLVMSNEKEAKKAIKAASLNRGTIKNLFPFHIFFADAPKEKMFALTSEESDYDAALGCFRYLEGIFQELRDFRAFELLRNQQVRSDYLLLKQARIVAMTCTHAAICRRRLLEVGFKYDNLLVEEAAQILEIETIVPMLLQPADGSTFYARNGGEDTSPDRDEPESTHSLKIYESKDEADAGRLKRICLIGDHQQLPPVVQNHEIRQYCNLDQTLFTRFIRLGVPYILLDQQGRARPCIAALYSWRYAPVINQGGGKFDVKLPSANMKGINLMDSVAVELAAAERQGGLSNLPHVLVSRQIAESKELSPSQSCENSALFQRANSGLRYTFQFIDVQDYNGQGETCPTPFFYQNLGEAE